VKYREFKAERDRTMTKLVEKCERKFGTTENPLPVGPDRNLTGIQILPEFPHAKRILAVEQGRRQERQKSISRIPVYAANTLSLL